MLHKNLNSSEAEAVFSIIKQNNVNPTSVSVDSDTLKYGGFCSSLKIVTVSDSESDKKLDLIIKSAPANPDLRKSIPFDVIFQREIYVYNVVFPTLQQLQSEHNVRDDFHSIPRCFFTSTYNLNEIVVLENLRIKGFCHWNQRTPMNFDHVKLVLEEYSKFHALSFALKVHKPSIFETVSREVNDIYMDIIESCGTTKTIQNLSSKVLDHLCLHEKFGSLVNRFRPLQENLTKIMKELVQANEAGKYGVISHGDNWCNNMLFKYEKNDSTTPLEIKFLDWQLARFGSPVLDLSYFLYTSATKETLDDLPKLLELYHNSLKEHLKKFSCSSDELFPFLVLQQHWRKFAKFGLGMAFLVVHVMVMDKNELPNVSSETQTGENFIDSFHLTSRNDSVYVDRMSDILLHFKENELF